MEPGVHTPRRLECGHCCPTTKGPARMRIRRGRLRELRTQRGMTQAQVARLIGCSRSTVSTWETTGNSPRPSRLRRLADVLGVPVQEIADFGLLPSLREMRVSAGLRQADIARRLRVQKSTYCDVETGRQRVPLRWFPVLSAELRVPAADLALLRDLPTSTRDRPRSGARERSAAGNRKREVRSFRVAPDVFMSG
ncbi:helix-turn-helix transcriptional regulator [Kitasatospora sp. NPDC017646]|uniref:helix-turn-helix transcriptional regulator n=1 Tax=Kitasatospora sp. NPDC017646 TaxID=3364024 RepID=UPI0037B8FF7A